MLSRVGQRLGNYVVRRHLHRRRIPGASLDVQLDRNRGAPGQRAQRRPEAALGQDRGVDSARYLAELILNRGQLVGDSTDAVPEALGAPAGTDLLSQAEFERQGDEPLLGSVMEVPLDPPAGCVRGGHDPSARLGQLRARIRIRDGRRDEFGELDDPLLDVEEEAVRSVTRR